MPKVTKAPLFAESIACSIAVLNCASSSITWSAGNTISTASLSFSMAESAAKAIAGAVFRAIGSIIIASAS